MSNWSNFDTSRLSGSFILGLALFVCALSDSAAAQDFTPGAGASCPRACVTTFHNDNARDGVTAYETILNPTVVQGTTFGLQASFTNLDGLVYAQPLYLSGVNMSSSNCTGTKDIAIVATENNTIYVYDVTAGDSIVECYHTNTNGSGENAIPFTDLSGTTPQCNNLAPQEGISGTRRSTLELRRPRSILSQRSRGQQQTGISN